MTLEKDIMIFRSIKTESISGGERIYFTQTTKLKEGGADFWVNTGFAYEGASVIGKQALPVLDSSLGWEERSKLYEESTPAFKVWSYRVKQGQYEHDILNQWTFVGVEKDELVGKLKELVGKERTSDIDYYQRNRSKDYELIVEQEFEEDEQK